MKKIFFFICFCLSAFSASAQTYRQSDITAMFVVQYVADIFGGDGMIGERMEHFLQEEKCISIQKIQKKMDKKQCEELSSLVSQNIGQDVSCITLEAGLEQTEKMPCQLGWGIFGPTVSFKNMSTALKASVIRQIKRGGYKMEFKDNVFSKTY